MAWDSTGYERHLEEVRASYRRSVPVVCAWGTCVADYDPVTKTILGGYGRPLCGCDNLPGWNASHPESKPMPAANVRAKGRHGSRVQRSRHRRRDWLAMVEDFERR